jgi:myo-inositol-1(or 4)-monophosphatase
MEELLIKTIECVKQAGQLYNCPDLRTKTKTCPADLVTAVDLSVQEFLTNALKELIPDSEVYGEEGNEVSADKLWVLDPVDGTLNLVHGYGRAVIALALMIKGKTVLGVVYDPETDECFYALEGKGAYLNGLPIHVSHNKHEQWLVAQGTSLYYSQYADRLFEAAKRVFMSCSDLRRCGSAAMEICLIACGRQDAYFEIGLKLWDYAAATLILTEAGGIGSDWHGEMLQPLGTAAFSNNIEHQWFIETLTAQ